MKKRFLRLFLATLLLTAVAVNAFGQAVGTTITYDGITYNFTSVAEPELTVTVTGADATVTGNVVIPATIKDAEGNKDYKVTSISCDFGSNEISCLTLPENMTYVENCSGSGIKKVIVPSTVTTVNEAYGFGCSSLEEFEVSTDNPNFKHGTCGEFITKDGTELVQYPAGRTATSYTVPDGITRITRLNAISNNNLTDLNFGTTVSTVNAQSLQCPNVENITIPATLTNLSSLTKLTRLKNYHVVEGHPVYSDIDGVLCNADQTELIGYPRGRLYEDYAIPSSIVTVKASAFKNCKFNSLDFTTATNLEVIEGGAFYGIGWPQQGGAVLETLDLSHTKLREIKGNAAFFNNGIKRLILPETIETIGAETFRYNPIEEANFPEGLKTIGDGAFQDSHLSTLHLPSTLTEFGAGAFNNNTYLKAITVAEDNPKYAADEEGVLYTKDFTGLVFYPRGKDDLEYAVNPNCKTLMSKSMVSCKFQKIIFPESLETIGNSALDTNSRLKEIVWPENCNLKTIDQFAFSQCTGLTSFDLPASVSTINAFAFQANNFTEFKIPDNSKLTSFTMGALRLCNKLETITIGKNTELRQFYGAGSNYGMPNKLTTFIIEEGNTKLTSLGGSLFKYMPAIETVTIAPDCGVTTLGASCFEGCQHLTSLTLPAAVTTLGDKCFYNTPNLSNLVFTDTDEHPAHLQTIGDNCFWKCGLTSFVVPRSVKTIKRQAFHECAVLETVSIPAGTTSVDKEAFYLCENLEAINVDKANMTYASSDGIFCNKLKETLIIYPAGKATEHFQLLPPSITKIGPMAFFYSKKLKNVMIPKHVTEIGYSAFFGCTNLKDIVLLGDDPNAITLISEGGEAPFTEVPTDATVWLRYDQTGEISDWNGFTNIDYCKMGVNDDANHQYEFFVMEEGSANVLSVKNNALDYTIVMPATVSDGTKTYHVDYLGDFMLEDAQENVKEVVVKHTPKYIGANAFDSQFNHADAFLCNDVDDMSTIRFEYDKATFNSRYIEGQNLYVKKSVAETLKDKEEWPDLADAIQWQVPLPVIKTTYGTFSREFAVDLDAINPDKENPNVIAFTAGRAKYDTEENLTTVTMVSINHEGDDPEGYSGEGDGTYIPANTGVLLKAYKGTSTAFTKATTDDETGETTEASGDYYQIAESQTDGYTRKNLMASVTEHSRTIQPTENGFTNFYVSQGKLWSFTVPRTSTVHKSYLQLPSDVFPAGAKLSMVFDVDDNGQGGTTGIDGVQTSDNSSDVIYNMQGQRVEKAVKGIYIINGKKVYVK